MAKLVVSTTSFQLFFFWMLSSQILCRILRNNAELWKIELKKNLKNEISSCRVSTSFDSSKGQTVLLTWVIPPLPFMDIMLNWSSDHTVDMNKCPFFFLACMKMVHFASVISRHGHFPQSILSECRGGSLPR